MAACEVCGNTNQNHLTKCSVCKKGVCVLCRRTVKDAQPNLVTLWTFAFCKECETGHQHEAAAIVADANGKMIAVLARWKEAASKQVAQSC